MLLNHGEPDNKYLKWYYRFKLPYYLTQYGYFPNRPWNRIINDMGFDVLQEKYFFNGTLQYRIISNKKNDKEFVKEN